MNELNVGDILYFIGKEGKIDWIYISKKVITEQYKNANGDTMTKDIVYYAIKNCSQITVRYYSDGWYDATNKRTKYFTSK